MAFENLIYYMHYIRKVLKIESSDGKMMLVLSVPRNGLEQEIGETLAAFVLRR